MWSATMTWSSTRSCPVQGQDRPSLTTLMGSEVAATGELTFDREATFHCGDAALVLRGIRNHGMLTLEDGTGTRQRAWPSSMDSTPSVSRSDCDTWEYHAFCPRRRHSSSAPHASPESRQRDTMFHVKQRRAIRASPAIPLSISLGTSGRHDSPNSIGRKVPCSRRKPYSPVWDDASVRTMRARSGSSDPNVFASASVYRSSAT